ncbi:imidazole glycerol phosphate synthase cyclase subunit [Gammaproteobacteria bacterium]|nr:imidazole glycerol phosphate synthase cyclase subunit [Gammaproteobacteria bacterium]
MNKVRVIARIDINNNSVVKGRCLEGLRKIGQPNKMAKKYYQDGVDEIIFLDAVASLYDRNSLIDILRQATRETFIPITIGGGIKTTEDIKDALSAGADKVAINTNAVNNLDFIREAIERFGSQAIVGSVVARRHRYSWEAFIDNAKHRTHKNAIEWARELELAGVGELLVTSIDNDGRLQGFDCELVASITNAVDIPVIASGGAGSVKDIVNLCMKTSCDAIAIASLLHYKIESVKSVKAKMIENHIGVRA